MIGTTTFFPRRHKCLLMLFKVTHAFACNAAYVYSRLLTNWHHVWCELIRECRNAHKHLWRRIRSSSNSLNHATKRKKVFASFPSSRRRKKSIKSSTLGNRLHRLRNYCTFFERIYMYTATSAQRRLLSASSTAKAIETNRSMERGWRLIHSSHLIVHSMCVCGSGVILMCNENSDIGGIANVDDVLHQYLMKCLSKTENTLVNARLLWTPCQPKLEDELAVVERKTMNRHVEAVWDTQSFCRDVKMMAGGKRIIHRIPATN